MPDSNKTLDDQERLNWLRLIRSENVGPATFRDLLARYYTAHDALNALPELAKRGGAAARIKICSEADAEREYQVCSHFNAQFIAMCEPDYPSYLRMADHCPPLLCVKGSIKTLNKKSVGIVGSRNASILGCKITQKFASELGMEGYVVVSGLARGIDANAHKASLECGTIAAFAGGLDKIYPEENTNLVQQILAYNGTIVSEMPMGWQARARDFPRRNRIIMGLSMGILVVEAAKRSGSLITARLANETGRLVFAIPGSPLDPRSDGTNHLIKQGAILVTDIEDMLEHLTPMNEPQLPYDSFSEDDGSSDKPTHDVSNTIRDQIITSLSASPVEVDDIIRFSGATAGEVQLVLLELTMAGRLERHSGNRVSLIG
ncbi:MAG: DNA-processing protein DprA [Rhizobiaceae bacterium]